jgi:GTP-binding protein
MDLEESAANLVKFRRRYKTDLVKISCATGEGLDELKELLYKGVRAHTPKPVRKPKPVN